MYDTPLKNEAVSDSGDGWESVEEQRVKKRLELDSNEDITALFGMTPYAHKTSEQDRNKLKGLEKLWVETDFGVAVYRKKL